MSSPLVEMTEGYGWRLFPFVAIGALFIVLFIGRLLAVMIFPRRWLRRRYHDSRDSLERLDRDLHDIFR